MKLKSEAEEAIPNGFRIQDLKSRIGNRNEGLDGTDEGPE